MRLGTVELSLIQIIIYALIWIGDPYIGFLLSLIIACISAAILIISLILELIEKSKVPKSYYRFMITATLCPIVVTILFIIFYPEALGWMDNAG